MIESVKSFILATLFSIILASTLIVAALCIGTAFAGDLDGFELDEVAFKHQHYLYHRSPLMPDSNGKDYIALNVKTTMLSYVYWNTLVHGTSDSAQYRQIGLNMKFGVRVFKSLDIEYDHHSQHLLDTTHPSSRFPVQDSIGFNLYFYRNNKFNSFF